MLIDVGQSIARTESLTISDYSRRMMVSGYGGRSVQHLPIHLRQQTRDSQMPRPSSIWASGYKISDHSARHLEARIYSTLTSPSFGVPSEVCLKRALPEDRTYIDTKVASMYCMCRLVLVNLPWSPRSPAQFTDICLTGTQDLVWQRLG